VFSVFSLLRTCGIFTFDFIKLEMYLLMHVCQTLVGPDESLIIVDIYQFGQRVIIPRTVTGSMELVL